MIYGFNKAKEDSLRTGELGTCNQCHLFTDFVLVYSQIQYLCSTKTQIQTAIAAVLTQNIFNTLTGFLKVSEDYPNTRGMMPKTGENTCNIQMEDNQAPEMQHCFDAGMV